MTTNPLTVNAEVENTAMLIYCHLLTHGNMTEDRIRRDLKLSGREWIQARKLLFKQCRLGTIIKMTGVKKYIALGVV